MGTNAWRDEQAWPLDRTRFTPWYLGAGGTLVPAMPTTDEDPDPFVYDPRNPVPTVGGKLLGIGEVAGPREQAAVGNRPDVLVYSSEPLPEPLELTGPVRAEVWLATDAPDTDVTAVLLDVHPNGEAWNLCEGAVRARHSGVAVPMLPGAVYRFALDLVATSIVLPAGHRLRLHVSSSSFPEWEPNPNTGRPIGADGEGDLRPAHQLVFHDARHPSHVMLPIIPS
jgi:putative CocE/NonD family hydrolase